MLRRDVLARIRNEQGALLVYYTPDDVMARHNLKQPLRRSFDIWDVFFTTKTYNVGELKAAGVRYPVLAGNAFDPAVHRPLSPAEAGGEFEAFDLVFVGALERERCASLNRLAEAGMTVLVHGARAGALASDWPDGPHPNITLRGPVFAEDYDAPSITARLRCASCARSTETTLRRARSSCRPWQGRCWRRRRTSMTRISSTVPSMWVSPPTTTWSQKAKALLADADRRRQIAVAARRRCLTSGYSTLDRAKEMIEVIRAKLEERRSEQTRLPAFVNGRLS